MMLTAADARNKWCPFASVIRGDAAAGFNRDLNMKPDVASYCIASDCMAWRWQPQASMDRPSKYSPGIESIKHEIGFCGLAGRP